MTWNNTLAIGIPEIDKQHKELCDSVDRLYAASTQGKGADEAVKILDFLADYTVKHFADEEKLQLKVKYPYYKEHKAVHTDFINQITKLKNEMNASGATIALLININQVISTWLIKHIMSEDKKIKEYVK